MVIRYALVNYRAQYLHKLIVLNLQYAYLRMFITYMFLSNEESLFQVYQNFTFFRF